VLLGQLGQEENLVSKVPAVYKDNKENKEDLVLEEQSEIVEIKDQEDCLVNLVFPDHPEKQVLMVDLVHQDFLVTLDNVDQSGYQEPQDYLVSPVSKVTKVFVDSLDNEEKKVVVEIVDVLDNEVSPDNVDPQEMQESLVSMEKMEIEDNQEKTEFLDPQDNLAHVVFQEVKVWLV